MRMKTNGWPVNGWTDERRRKQSESIRRWKPWAKSTGPRTGKGKTIAKQNALKHGFRSQNYRELRQMLRLQRDFVRNVRAELKHKTQTGQKRDMARHKKGNIVNGWINLDKPAGMGSTTAVAKVRRALNAQKVGHAGTLDPLATGILPIALGEATKTIPFCQDGLKTYKFSAIWGEARATDDAEGDVTETSDNRPAAEDVQAILPQFIGDIEQIPPAFSAIKIDGQRAYDLARNGEMPEMKSRPAYIESLELLETHPDKATFRCVCGKGTYMRSLARDMAKALGTVGYITDLRREAVGPFTLENAISLAKLEEIDNSSPLDSVLLPVETVLDDIPALALNEREASQLKNGQKLSFISRPDVERLQKAGFDLDTEATALALYNGKPIALVTVQGVEIQPVRVLNL